jgi:lipopolysaccharide exporter
MIVLGISFAVGSAKNIGTVDFMKRLNFSREFYIQSMPKLLGVSVAILVAWLYRSYWALVLATMTNRTTVLVMSFYMSDYRPKWALGGWRKLFSFSGWLMATQVLQAIILRMERFILGAMMTPAVVGLYHVGYEVSSMVTSELAVPIRSALFPGLAAQSSDVAAMKQLWFRSVDVLTAVGLPIGIGLGLVASEFIPVVLGDQWFMAIPVVQVLAPVLGGLVIIGSHSTILMALGRTDMLLRITLVQFPLRAILITALIASSGLAGAVIAQALTGLVWFAQILVSTSRATGIAWLEPFRRTWRSFVSAGVMSICVAGVGHWLGAGPAMMSDGWLLTWKVACGAVTYTVTHWLLWQIAARPDGIERIAFAALSEMRGRAAG